ncbi:hypothetical protein AALP_AAs40209U000100 [Arabis alpina]|uniref:Uncharacterized protein n=1 Tax=Arabis alpina TaxID=50452 RepID=A0A087G2K6_ARAAL|nr:hypothetical protein AALP_AAs40209U000100 [Arabis alpina]
MERLESEFDFDTDGRSSDVVENDNVDMVVAPICDDTRDLVRGMEDARSSLRDSHIGLTIVDDQTSGVLTSSNQHADDPMRLARHDSFTSVKRRDRPGDDPTRSVRQGGDPTTLNESTEVTNVVEDSWFVDDTDQQLPPGKVDASLSPPSSSSSGSRVSSFERDDEDMLGEVEQTKQVAPKLKAKVRPNPPGSTLSDKKSLQRLRKKCGISEEIVLVLPDSADRANAPPPGYLTLFENYFDQCLLLFPLPWFLLRFLAANNASLSSCHHF